MSLKSGLDVNPNVFFGIIADVQQCFCSLVVHREAEGVFGGRRGGGESLPIIPSQLGHKVVATLVHVRGSTCLTLETERTISETNRGRRPGFRLQRGLTPLVAHQHWTGCVPGAVVSLPVAEQVVPEHRGALNRRQEAGRAR